MISAINAALVRLNTGYWCCILDIHASAVPYFNPSSIIHFSGTDIVHPFYFSLFHGLILFFKCDSFLSAIHHISSENANRKTICIFQKRCDELLKVMNHVRKIKLGHGITKNKEDERHEFQRNAWSKIDGNRELQNHVHREYDSWEDVLIYKIWTISHSSRRSDGGRSEVQISLSMASKMFSLGLRSEVEFFIGSGYPHPTCSLGRVDAINLMEWKILMMELTICEF